MITIQQVYARMAQLIPEGQGVLRSSPVGVSIEAFGRALLDCLQSDPVARTDEQKFEYYRGLWQGLCGDLGVHKYHPTKNAQETAREILKSLRARAEAPTWIADAWQALGSKATGGTWTQVLAEITNRCHALREERHVREQLAGQIIETTKQRDEAVKQREQYAQTAADATRFVNSEATKITKALGLTRNLSWHEIEQEGRKLFEAHGYVENQRITLQARVVELEAAIEANAAHALKCEHERITSNAECNALARQVNALEGELERVKLLIGNAAGCLPTPCELAKIEWSSIADSIASTLKALLDLKIQSSQALAAVTLANEATARERKRANEAEVRIANYRIAFEAIK